MHSVSLHIPESDHSNVGAAIAWGQQGVGVAP